MFCVYYVLKLLKSLLISYVQVLRKPYKSGYFIFIPNGIIFPQHCQHVLHTVVSRFIMTTDGCPKVMSL